MLKIAIALVLTLSSASVAVSAGIDDAAARSAWPQWRGPLGTGVSPDGDPPTAWSEKQNVLWKTVLPGSGHSTPIVWGERVFVTAAEPFGEALPPKYDTAEGAHDGVPVTHRHRYLVVALDRRDGTIAWQKTVREEIPHEGGHVTGSYASASPATDGEHIFAHFGSRGLYCLDFDGKIVWQADLGRMLTKHAHGEASSPVLHGDLLAVNWDCETGSFVAALNTKTGKQVWKVARDEETSWSSPIVVADPPKNSGDNEGKPQLVVSGTKRVRGYDLATGKLLWECGGLSSNIVASPVAADGMVFAGSSYEKQAFVAIRLDGARGDVSATDRVAWRLDRRTPYVPSPLLYKGSLYFLRHYQGVLTRMDAATGKERQAPLRLEGMDEIYASPVAAADRLYVTDREGVTLVLSHGEAPKVIARNRLDTQISASAAIAGRELFLRGARHLYCIAER